MKRLAAIFLLTAAAHAQQPVLDGYLSELAETSLRNRAARVATLTPADAPQRRSWVREKMLAQIGGLPSERTPLNARITGTFTRPGYRVEKLIYDSLPGFHVTANVYVPLTGRPPYPAVVGVAGHSANGKASATYQHVWITLARRGFVVLAFDPPGQGERIETLDPATGTSRVGIGTSEHTLIGTQSLLAGGHIARYEIWDGVRAVDYLHTRPDVDPRKIAVAGNSGGGTQAAYLAVADPRLSAIVSSCYMTSWKQLWYKPGPQDGEQVFPGFLRDELDFPDFAFAAAPTPFLMTTAIQDFFPIAGARATYQDIRRFYTLLDAQAKAGYFEYDDTHGWSKPRREAAYRWLEQWLAGRDSSGPEADLETEAEQSLYVTPTGQVHSSLGGETSQSLNARDALRVYADRTAAKQPLDRKTVNERAVVAPSPIRFRESVIHVPEGSGKHPAVIALNAAKADIDAMKAAGHAVLSLDFPVAQWATANRALLVGRTMVGLELSDVLNAFQDLTRRGDIDPAHIRIYGRGNAAVLALHAAFLTPQIQAVAAEAMPLSWLAVTQAKFHRGLIGIVIPGVLKDYDLPDLAKAIAPRPVWIVDARNPSGVPLLENAVKTEYPKSTVLYRPEGWTFSKVYRAWLTADR